MDTGARRVDDLAGPEPVTWYEPAGLVGAALDRLLSPGWFVVTEPDMSEFVCADRRQLAGKLEECEACGIAPVVRWRRSDGTLERRRGHPPAGWGAEDRPATSPCTDAILMIEPLPRGIIHGSTARVKHTAPIIVTE